MELRFIRDTDKRAIDFVILQDKKPLFAVECKPGERVLSSAINYFKERTEIPSFYQVHTGTKDVLKKDAEFYHLRHFVKNWECRKDGDWFCVAG